MKKFLLRARNTVMLALKYMTRSTFRAACMYKKMQKLPIIDNMVLFEAHRGVKFADNTYALFKCMIEDERFKSFTYIINFNDKHNYYIEKYRHLPNVHVVGRHSRKYIRYLCQAKYLINNKTFHHEFVKRPEQVNVLTWHATAFKHLGKDTKGTLGQFRNVTRNYLQVDYLVSPNRFTSDVLLNSGDVRELFKGYVVEEGYPRIDLTFNTKPEDIKSLLMANVDVDFSKKLVLYAPTWRGEMAHSQDIMASVFTHIEELQRSMPEDCELLLKVHDLTYKYLEKHPDRHKYKCVPDFIDTNELLAIMDVVITDYSSIFIDFMVLRRPVIFFVYDLDEYDHSRGLYFDMADMPGPLCTTSEEVTHALRHLTATQDIYRDKYEEMLNFFCYREDGHASERVIDIVFKGKVTENMYKTYAENKVKILAYAGDLKDSRAVAAFKSFAEGLDYNRYDLALYFDKKVNPANTAVITSLDPNVKVFYTVGNWNAPFRMQCNKYAVEQMPPEKRVANYEKYAFVYVDEVIRNTGAVAFDLALCFAVDVGYTVAGFALSDIPVKVMYLSENSKFKKDPLLSFAKRHFKLYEESAAADGKREGDMAPSSENGPKDMQGFYAALAEYCGGQ
jgi:CDP-glycerol glycerophosphotransferase